MRYFTYRVIQGERSVVWEVTASVIVRKQGHIRVCLVRNGHPGGAF